MSWRVIEGDCVEVMAQLEAASVDAVVTDPPYGLEFMGKEWDRLGVRGDKRGIVDPVAWGGGESSPFSRARIRWQTGAGTNLAMIEWYGTWATEALRVLKPGGHLLAFGGTRTYHLLACALAFAGFEIRDCLAWLYGQGFPKSLDVSKAIDRELRAERQVVGSRRVSRDISRARPVHEQPSHAVDIPVTEAATTEARRWEGWGTALKPAFEPVVVARRPLAARSVAANILEHGVGGLNVAAGRIGFASEADERESKAHNRHGDWGTEQGGNQVYGDFSMLPPRGNYDAPGRWPANVALGHHPECEPTGVVVEVDGDGHYPASRKPTPFAHGSQEGLEERSAKGEPVEVWLCHPDCPVRILDEQTGDLGKSEGATRGEWGRHGIYGGAKGWDELRPVGYGHRGGASRFFYTAKADRAEREVGRLYSGRVHYCKITGWDDDGKASPTAPGALPPRGTGGDTEEDGRASSTTGSGKTTTGRSPKASRSITETATRPTTGSRTSSSSTRPTTSGPTPPTTDELPTGRGSGGAESAASGSPRPPSTTTSRARAGSSTDGADPATSPESSPTSERVEVCPNCGEVMPVGVANSHPT